MLIEITMKYTVCFCYFQAGIAGEQLLICLEPEAAAIFCQTVPCQSQSSLSPSQLHCFHPGNKYIVIDAGGKYLTVTIFCMYVLYADCL